MRMIRPLIKDGKMEFSESQLVRSKAYQHSMLFDILEEAKNFSDHALEKRKFSSEFDLALGFKIKKIEETLRAKALAIDPDSYFDKWGPLLHQGAQTWVGLDFQILQCSYHDLYQIFITLKMKPHQKIVDLGAGYGRIGIFLHHFLPEASFLGIELVKERVDEANRIYDLYGLSNKTMEEGDLSLLRELPSGDFYFIYDFGSEEHLLKILELFKKEPGKTLIVKGQILRRLIEKDPFFNEGLRIKKCEDVLVYLT